VLCGEGGGVRGGVVGGVGCAHGWANGQWLCPGNKALLTAPTQPSSHATQCPLPYVPGRWHNHKAEKCPWEVPGIVEGRVGSGKHGAGRGGTGGAQAVSALVRAKTWQGSGPARQSSAGRRAAAAAACAACMPWGKNIAGEEARLQVLRGVRRCRPCRAFSNSRRRRHARRCDTAGTQECCAMSHSAQVRIVRGRQNFNA